MALGPRPLLTGACRAACVAAAALAPVGAVHAQQLPGPPPGEYVCTQTELSASIPDAGRAQSLTAVSMPSAFGNLIIERGGTYRMSSSRARAAAFRFDPARGAVTFAGLLAPFANTYGTRGKDLFFDFASRAISFSCALTPTVDRGNAQGQRQAPAGTTATPAARTPLQGTLYFAGRTGLQKLTLTDGTQATLSSTWQFDVRGTEVLLVDATGALRITNEDGAGSRPVPVYGTGNQAPRFSPDGRRIVLLGSQPPTSVAAAIIGATTSADLEPLIVGRDGRVIAAFGSPYTQPAWTPDGRLVMAGAKARGSLAGNAATGIFLSGASGSAVRRIDPGFDAPHSPAVSADGRVAFVNGTRIWVMPLSGANPPARLAEGSSPGIGALAWSPDGRSLAFADGDVVKVVMPDGRVVPVQDAAGNGVRSTGPLVWR